MLRKSIAFLATALAVGAPDSLSNSAFHAGGLNRGEAHGFAGGDHRSGRHKGDGLRRGHCDNLFGGTFALPYCDYCTAHPGDRSC
jgi:hypothetical protein